jgi:hypothetical protein
MPLVGWAAFILDLGGPALALLLGVAATVGALVTGDTAAGAAVAVGVGGGAAVAARTMQRRQDADARRTRDVQELVPPPETTT